MAVDSNVLEIPGFPGPLYAQVAAYLRRKISNAEWNRKGPIPNETSLAKDIGVSVGTVRKALEILEREHLIERRQGRGTFILEASDENDLQRFSRLSLDGGPLRMEPVSVETSTGEADADEAGRLGLRVNDAVIRLDLNWRAGSGFKAIERIVVSTLRFPGLEALQTLSSPFLFALYRSRYQTVVTHVTERLTAVMADQEVANRLGVEPGQALLSIDRVAAASGIGPVEWSVRHIMLGRATYSVRMN